MSRILVADDEAAIRKVVRDALQKAGHDVETAIDGEEAERLFEDGDFDLIVADLNMPRLDGLELVRRIRQISRVPVLVLTVRHEERDKVRLLDAGADDYVTKPFGVAELVARSKALLRRSGGRPDALQGVRFGEVEVEPGTRTVRLSGSPVHLTPTEYSLLIALLSRPGGVWTHKQLLAEVWGSSAGVSSDTLRVHMGSLRRKLEPEPDRPRYIRTEPWVGYRFTPEG